MKKLILSSILFLQSIFAVAGEPAPCKREEVSVVVLGGGVGALTSALYLSRAEMNPIVIEGPMPGGLITQSHAVQNWPGEMEISGYELADKVRKQAEASGAHFYREEVVKVDFSKRPFFLETRSLDDGKTSRYLQTESVVIAMGTEPNHLGIDGEMGYWGKGVTNCAICDGNLFRKMTVGVVGGGDAAVLEALYLSNIASEVHVFVRKNSFKGVEAKRLEALLAKKNVHVLFGATVEEVKGNGSKVTGVVLKSDQNPHSELALDGLFLAIGSKPNTRIFQGALELDAQGYIVLKNGQRTSVDGVYAIGDIVDPVYKQAISAAGDGAKAAVQCQQYVSDRAGQLVLQKQRSAQPKNSPEVIEITSVEQFERELKASDVPIFVDFYATWCGPCRQISPRIEKSACHLTGQVKFLKVNVDQVEKLSRRYDVRAMPTALLFQSDGRISERKVGSDQIFHLLENLEGRD